MQIRIYGKPDCIWCSRAKALCEARSYEHSYADFTTDKKARTALEKMLGRKDFTAPQMVIGDTVIGGFTELALADNDGRLQQLIAGE